jgi:peptidyl-prolyl cis-trans isomerase D
MFDLFRSREKSVRILLGALLLLVALSMLTYLVPNYGSGSGSSDDTIVAEVGDIPVTLQEVQRTIQAATRSRQMPPEVLGTYIPQMIEGIINERAMVYQAERLGFQISDADLAVSIQTAAPGLFQDGKFVGREAYASMLAQQNMTIPEFEREMRRSLLITRLSNFASQGAVVSPQEVEREFRKRNEKAKVEYVRLLSDHYKAEIQPTEQEIKASYDFSKLRYQLPQTKNLAVLIVDQAQLESQINPTDADLQRAYNQSKESFRVPERIKERHILLKTSGNAAQDEKVKAKAEGLLKQLKAGGDFAELAKKNSEDPGSAKEGGMLGDWVTRGQMVPEFEKVSFSLPLRQLSDLVKTQYGYHIVEVMAKETAHLRTFDEVKGEIAAQWKKQRGGQIMEETASKAQNALVKNPSNPETVATGLGLQIVRAAAVAPGDPIPNIGANKDFDDAIASLKKGEVSQPVGLPGNRTVVAVVTEVNPVRRQTLDEVRARVRETLVSEKLGTVVGRHADELAAKVKAMGGDLRAAAKALGLEVKTSEEFTRAGAVEGVGSAAYLQDVFNKPVGAIVGPLAITDGRAVVKVLAHIEPSTADLAAQQAGIREELRSSKARDRKALFENGLRQELLRQGKIKIHQDVINRLTSTYRG